MYVKLHSNEIKRLQQVVTYFHEIGLFFHNFYLDGYIYLVSNPALFAWAILKFQINFLPHKCPTLNVS
jgi:hypothetical protein